MLHIPAASRKFQLEYGYVTPQMSLNLTLNMIIITFQTRLMT